MHRIQIIHCGWAAVNIREIKLEVAEQVITNVDVAAAFFTPSPKIYSRGTTKLPPPLPIRPEKKPKTDPLETPNMVFLLFVNSKLFGFQPISIIIAAAAVNIENISYTLLLW